MRKWALVALLLLLILVLFSVVLAQSGQFELPWHSINSGGGSSSGGKLALQAAVGQADSGSLSGGAFTVEGGFLVSPLSPESQQELVFLPLLRKPF
jgi:hypothetical protein